MELATRTEPQAERDCTCDVAVTVIAVSIAKWKQLVVEQRQAGRRCDGAKKTTGNSMTPAHYTPGRRQLWKEQVTSHVVLSVGMERRGLLGQLAVTSATRAIHNRDDKYRASRLIIITIEGGVLKSKTIAFVLQTYLRIKYQSFIFTSHKWYLNLENDECIFSDGTL